MIQGTLAARLPTTEVICVKCKINSEKPLYGLFLDAGFEFSAKKHPRVHFKALKGKEIQKFTS